MNPPLTATPAEILADLRKKDLALRRRAVALAGRYLAPEALEPLLRDGADAIGRNAALAALERQGPAATGFLVSLLEDPDADVVMFAAEALGDIGDGSAVDLLCRAARHQNLNVAQAVLVALGKLGGEKALATLIEALAADPWIAFAAAQALGALGDARASDPLLDRVNDEMLAETVLGAVGTIGSPASLPRLVDLLTADSFRHLQEPVLIAIGAIVSRHDDKHAAIQSLRRLILDRKKKTPAFYAAEPERNDLLSVALAAIAPAAGFEELTPLILRAAAASEPGLAIARLLVLHDPIVATACWRLRRHPDPRLRRGALLVLGKRYGSVEEILAALDDRDPSVRAAAGRLLGKLGVDQAAKALWCRFRDGEGQEREEAFSALSRLAPEALDFLVGGLDPGTKDPSARLAVLLAARVPVSAEILVPFLGNDDLAVRSQAVKILAVDRGPEKSEILDRLVDDEGQPEEVRVDALRALAMRPTGEVIRSMEWRLRSPGLIRHQVIKALGQVGAKKSGPALDAIYEGAEPIERAAILDALSRLNPERAKERAMEALDDPDEEVRRTAAGVFALLASREDRERVAAMAGSDDWVLRRAAAVAYTKLTPSRDDPTLLLLARDIEPVVARTARDALRKAS